MKFAHLADCHIGAWSEPRLRNLSLEAFKTAINICIEKHVAFILIAGDLFDTALPPLELVREVTAQLAKARKQNIQIYIIPGSHDCSPSGKTILDILEKANLCIIPNKFSNNLLQFSEDKTSAKISGLWGKRNGLELQDYQSLQTSHLEKEPGFKIFMLHTSLESFLPKELSMIPVLPLSSLPKNFNYYALGHIHYKLHKKSSDNIIAQPGSLFPVNFLELEKYNHGGFYIVDDSLEIEFIPIKLKEVIPIKIEASTPKEIKTRITQEVSNLDIRDKIITLRISGILKEGKLSDLDLRKITKQLEETAFLVLTNTTKLTTKEFEELKIDSGTAEEIENTLLKRSLKEKEHSLALSLMHILDKEKEEGERVQDFEDKILKEAKKVLKLEL